MRPATVVKFGGSAFGAGCVNVGTILDRVGELARAGKVLAVFSAPLVELDGKRQSLTDVALGLGAAWAAGDRRDPDVLFAPLRDLATRHVPADRREACLAALDEHHRRARAELVMAGENRRCADVTRARLLASSGELATAMIMEHALAGRGLRTASIPFADWPLITDEQYEHAHFRHAESCARRGPLLAALEAADVVTIGGFIGRTLDGLETTFERGGTDRSAIDLGILLREHYQVTVRLEKDVPVYSADPRWERRSLEMLRYLSWDEAQMAAMLGMRIVDPIAIRDLADHGAEVEVVVAHLHDPARVTRIGREREAEPQNPLKLVVGRQDCAIVRLAETAAAHLVAALTLEKQYGEFIQLSEAVHLGRRRARLLFLDASFVRRHERWIRAYDPAAELVYGRGVVGVIGDHVWSAPTAVSVATGALGHEQLRIMDMDVQEETPRILIVLEDVGDAVARAVRAIHAQRHAFSRSPAP